MLSLQVKKEKIVRAFENKGIYIELHNIIYYDEYIQVQEYDSSRRVLSLELRIDKVCNQLGSSGWEWHNGENMINIFF